MSQKIKKIAKMRTSGVIVGPKPIRPKPPSKKTMKSIRRASREVSKASPSKKAKLLETALDLVEKGSKTPSKNCNQG